MTDLWQENNHHFRKIVVFDFTPNRIFVCNHYFQISNNNSVISYPPKEPTQCAKLLTRVNFIL